MSSASRLSTHAPFVFYFVARSLSEFAYQIGAVAIGWEIYALTNSPLALGLVGLSQFLPTLIFTLIAGHVADRYDRRRVVFLCQLAQAAAALFLAVVNYLFVNTSSQLGEFESGVLASLIGAVPTAALGGLGTIVVAVIWMRLFPQLRHWEGVS